MKKSMLLSLSAIVTALVMTVVGCGEVKEEKVDPTIIANLQAAYNGESNASAKYAMYAQKADAAGYKSVAALFRATSKSESIHAARQAAVLKSLGVEAKKEIKLPVYVDVKTSLQDAIKGETYEFTKMYPEFLADAKAKKASKKIIEAFQYAMEAEKEHAKLYGNALANLEGWKKAGKTIYVCEVCGYTTGSKPTVCILCASPFEKFEVFQ